MSPPFLFNLVENTGFDIESLIFSFVIGGIGTVLYQCGFKNKIFVGLTWLWSYFNYEKSNRFIIRKYKKENPHAYVEKI